MAGFFGQVAQNVWQHTSSLTNKNYQEATRRIKEAQKNQAYELSLSGLMLTRVPKEVGGLTHLLTLELSDNRLTTLPSSLGQLSRLQSLDLSNNGLSMLPPELGPEARLHAAMRYACLAGGKRLRPYLVAAGAALFDVPRVRAVRVGASPIRR